MLRSIKLISQTQIALGHKTHEELEVNPPVSVTTPSFASVVSRACYFEQTTLPQPT